MCDVHGALSTLKPLLKAWGTQGRARGVGFFRPGAGVPGVHRELPAKARGPALDSQAAPTQDS